MLLQENYRAAKPEDSQLWLSDILPWMARIPSWTREHKNRIDPHRPAQILDPCGSLPESCRWLSRNLHASSCSGNNGPLNKAGKLPCFSWKSCSIVLVAAR